MQIENVQETAENSCKIFAYRRKELATEPLSDYLRDTLRQALGMVITIIGQYGSRVSAIHLGKMEVATYHNIDFHPRAALVLGRETVDIKPVSRPGMSRYQTYQLPISPSNQIIPVQNRIESEDFVFQIGVRKSHDNQVTFGVIEPIFRHLNTDKESEISVEVGSESGSGVFSVKGGLIGMTLGHISPDIMLATSIDHLLQLS
ncbi:MAG: hypothetical protein WCV55_03355 [Candidatus Paceibacterota bacterium]